LPAAAAAMMSSSFVSGTIVCPAFQVKIWRFHAPPAYPISVGMKFSTLQFVASSGNAAVFAAHWTSGAWSARGEFLSTMW
jgi:hypothetical protein